MFLGSSCIYPKLAPQPLKEEYLLTGELEPTNEPYAIAKITGIKMCDAFRSQFGCNFISVMPTNLYGTNDNYDLNNSHVLPALIRKFHEAKMRNDPFVTIWGSGKPRSQGTRMRCARLEMGTNSVIPCTVPRMMASRTSTTRLSFSRAVSRIRIEYSRRRALH